MGAWVCQFRPPFILKSKHMNGNFSFLGGTEVPRAGIYPKPIILCLSEVAKWWPEDSIWPARVCHWPMQCFSFNWISHQHSKFKKFHIKNPDFQIFLGKRQRSANTKPTFFPNRCCFLGAGAVGGCLWNTPRLACPYSWLRSCLVGMSFYTLRI